MFTGVKSPLYYVWASMKHRCLNVKAAAYPSYGGRGITVCEEWLEFYRFKNWALNNGYNSFVFLDRIDNDKGYFPENCRFASPKVSALNRRGNKYISAFGETKPLQSWVEDPRCSVTKSALSRRISSGWPTEFSIITPSHRSNRKPNS